MPFNEWMNWLIGKVSIKMLNSEEITEKTIIVDKHRKGKVWIEKATGHYKRSVVKEEKRKWKMLEWLLTLLSIFT